MVGPRRPQFVLFGSSIVQKSFGNGGWGAILADTYARKADIVMRGYGGWNSRNALQVLDQIFPKDAAVQPSLVITYFGGNDSMKPIPAELSSHVPLPEFIENMKKIATHLKSLSEKTRVIFLGVPPANDEMIIQFYGERAARSNEGGRIYSEATLKLCQELEVKAIDLWTIMQQKNDWLTTCFTDGVHLASEGSKIVAKEIMRALEEAEWEPSLYWKLMPSEFVGISPFDSEGNNGTIINSNM
ncbi:hypothetical protein POPTR_016G115800v4 [Populus trichocarpa]|uniref:SGNH hydrolase-type esterase domain-containing protein n=1 Tax=Populus trichocarpa TaxID=3694 RepID=B9IG91_POPTR|nr:GDSL esterase/lipase WDL1 [Populus trichocarpa]PNS99119.1 hypothetical protein POPTR_016G115800v4 [Populus trichocarpa]|eukprot:XP_002322977.1 GDSL esterase/lipase CPRD49 isoform X2 [Populus trichocarpa]